METGLPEPEQDGSQELQPLAEWLNGLNQQLTAQGAANAERAFGLGCSSSLGPAIVLVGLAFLLGARHLVSLLLVGLAVGLLALTWAAYVAWKAERRTVERSWQEMVWPELELGLVQRSLTIDQALQEARGLLLEQTPLRRCLEHAVHTKNRE